MMMSPTAGGRCRKVTFSAMNRSPTSYVGYIEREGMYLASATYLQLVLAQWLVETPAVDAT